MRFTPLTRQLLVETLSRWITDLPGDHPAVGVDGAVEVGASELADVIADGVRALGRPVLRTSTSWWWRPASLRLELGRTDLDMLLYGWVDGAALRRELFGPLTSVGSASLVRRLRDPVTDRAVRATPEPIERRAVVLIDGPFLRAAQLPLDHVVHLQVSAGALVRAMPPDRAWWLAAFDRYQHEFDPADAADVVVSYDHPGSPAVRWATGQH